MEEAPIQIKQSKTKPLVVGDKVFRSANDYDLSSEDIERAKKELGETEEVRLSSLKKLKQLVSENNLKFRTDANYLLRFLRCGKFNLDAAYKKIKFMCKYRKDYPEFYCTLVPNFEELLNRNMFIYLPYRDEEGSIVFVDKFGKWDVDELTPFNLLQFFQSIADVITMNPSCQINKIISIFDCKDIYIRQSTAFLNPVTLWHCLSVWQNMYPWRIKYIIIVNCNNLVYSLLKATRHLIKKKIADRIVIIDSDWSKLHEYLNPAILPKEYGGYLEESECSITKHLMNNIDYIQYELSFSKI